MELHCLLVETSTSASSCSMDPVYDNCPPFTQRGRDREMESRVVYPAVTRPPGLCIPQTVLAPAVAEVPTRVSEGRAPGSVPDHSYCGWRGGLGVLAHDPGINRIRGGGGGGGGGYWPDDSTQLYHIPSPTQSTEHQSTLSFYDNLSGAETPDHIEVFEMEPSFQEHFQEDMWASKLIQVAADEGGPWLESGCDNQNQEIKHQQELGSVSCGFVQEDQMLHIHQSSQQHRQALWQQSKAQHQAQTPWAPKVPPPLPLADPSASALRSLLTNLQQHIVRQQEVYEARIVSLQERNEELQEEVVRLKTNLSRQRHWYQAVQAKITESERERAAAELCNSALQKDMEQFFDTFGELNNEAKKTENIIRSF
ncbi:uncharacterized protein LOC129189585 [Dunckerocampus dactyliophorus]|uniref:uncharacterized protein LOC129189585 n=1 Tax=Dunckerocampus dactyliophorus TaxID=161453 RepID=UPI002405DA13|nr:uncharacterized protein LOC129189585 [Dunckerocampus dactyliophorus]